MKIIREGHECDVSHLLGELGTIVECEECGRQWKQVKEWTGGKTWAPVFWRRRHR